MPAPARPPMSRAVPSVSAPVLAHLARSRPATLDSVPDSAWSGGTVPSMATAQGRSKHDQVVEATAATERLMRPQEIPVNVYEATDALVVVAPLPAVRPEDVTIDLWPGRMRITAALRSAGPRSYLLHEWDYGG